MKSHIQVISSHVVLHEKRGRFNSYGREFPYIIHSPADRRRAEAEARAYGVQHLETLTAQKRNATKDPNATLTLREEQFGVHDQTPGPTQPQSARANQIETPDTAKIDAINLSRQGLTEQQFRRREGAMAAARDKAALKQTNQATKEQRQADPGRQRQGRWLDKVRAAQKSDPKTRPELIQQFDAIQAAFDAGASVADVSRAVKATGTPQPAAELPENTEWDFDPLLKG